MADSFLDTVNKNEPCQVMPPTNLPMACSLSRSKTLSRQGLLQWFREGKLPGKGFALVDLRRTYFEVCWMPIQRRQHVNWHALQGGTIKGSLNLPAQSLYPAIPTLYSLLSISKVKHVVWYCGQFLFCEPKEENIILFSLYLGSSSGRGTRAAGWFADYIVEQGETSMKSLVLEGGIRGWATAGSEYTELMSEYDVSLWTK